MVQPGNTPGHNPEIGGSNPLAPTKCRECDDHIVACECTNFAVKFAKRLELRSLPFPGIAKYYGISPSSKNLKFKSLDREKTR